MAGVAGGEGAGAVAAHRAHQFRLHLLRELVGDQVELFEHVVREVGGHQLVEALAERAALVKLEVGEADERADEPEGGDAG